MALVALPLALFLVDACGSPDRLDVMVSWTFVDGRDCTNAGVDMVQLSSSEDPDGTPPRSYICRAGTLGKQALFPGVIPAGDLQAAALSTEGGVLYRATSPFDSSSPMPVALVFYFTGG